MNAQVMQDGMIKSFKHQSKKRVPSLLGFQRNLTYPTICFWLLLPSMRCPLVGLLEQMDLVLFLGQQLMNMRIVTTSEILMVSIQSFDLLIIIL